MLLGLYRVAESAQAKVTKQDRKTWKVKEERKWNNVMASDGGVSMITKQVEGHRVTWNGGE